jgi:hypothetical protein
MAISMSRNLLSLGAATIAAAMVAVPATAGALPPVPLAPKCSWMLPDGVWLIQDNNVDVLTEIKNNRSTGHMQYILNGKMDNVTEGDATGGMNQDGHTFAFRVHWTKGPGTGFSNTYQG